MNTDWIKENLNTLFNVPAYDDINYLISSKMERFSGKLYKYFSFSENDSNYSLSNLRDGIIYFSNPVDFNDPFDCALGFSIDEALSAITTKQINEKVKIDGENEELVKELLKTLICNEQTPISCDNPTLEVIRILFSSPYMSEIIRAILDGKTVDEDSMKLALVKTLSESAFSSQILKSLLSPHSHIDINAVRKHDIFRAIINGLINNPSLIDIIGKEVSPQDNTMTNGLKTLLATDSIVDTIAKLFKLIGNNEHEILKTIENINCQIDSLIPKIKETINKSFAISCFSTSSDNILMWSHYGAKHSGFCVEYDFSKMKSRNILLLLFPAIYSEKRPTVPMSLFDFDNMDNIKLSNNITAISDIFIALLTKSRIWNYENEWRIIASKADLENQKLYEDIAVKVYYGANISIHNKIKLETIVRGKGLEAEQYRLDVDKYKLLLK